jgi:hypothetical protein
VVVDKSGTGVGILWRNHSPGMGRQDKLSDEDQRRLDEGWDEIGHSISMLVVSGTKDLKWAWEMLEPLALYESWMLKSWIEKCREMHPELDPKRKSKGPGRPSLTQIHGSTLRGSSAIQQSLKDLKVQRQQGRAE